MKVMQWTYQWFWKHFVEFSLLLYIFLCFEAEILYPCLLGSDSRLSLQVRDVKLSKCQKGETLAGSWISLTKLHMRFGYLRYQCICFIDYQMHVPSLHFVAWLKPRNYVSWSHSVFELACWIQLPFCLLAHDVTSCPSSNVSEQRRHLKASLLAVFKGLPFSPSQLLTVSGVQYNTVPSVHKREKKTEVFHWCWILWG
jgi:hypothetical protein